MGTQNLRSPGIGTRQSGGLGKENEWPGILTSQITAQEQREGGAESGWTSLSCLDGDLFKNSDGPVPAHWAYVTPALEKWDDRRRGSGQGLVAGVSTRQP